MLHRTNPSDAAPISAWFAGPKAENGDWFAEVIRRIVSDYHAWRRNYFPEDGVVVDSAARREAEPFRDRFDDRLIELLGKLKHDVPFQSPRYAGHMIAEQSLPAIAGYLAAMLYNPNNVSPDAAPVTVRLELEAAQMIARMLGHPGDGWAHLTGGGTIANLEALWVARSVKYLPLTVAEARRSLGLETTGSIDDPGDRASLLAMPSLLALADYARLFKQAAARLGAGPATLQTVQEALLQSRFNPAQRGMASVVHSLGSSPVLLAPETHHYCFEKAMDVLGLGRDALVSVRVDPEFRMRVDDLEARLIESERQGRHVLAVVAVVGTTEEGAVDPVDQILALRTARETSGRGSFWIHVDAAYGGYLRTLTVPTRAGLGPPTTRVQVGGAVRDLPLDLPHRHACDALERLGDCDSITIDPHKLGYVPYPAGCVCFRSHLVKPLARQHAPYLADDAGDPQTEARSDSIGLYVLEGSKPGAAAAAVWLSHTLIPLNSAGHGALVRQTIRNACELHALLDQYPRLTDAAGAPSPVRAVCLCPPGSNIVCYAFAPAAGRPCSLKQLNAANEAIYQRFSVHPGQRVTDQPFFVSRTTLSSARYAPDTVADFLRRLSVPAGGYAGEGVFLLRSVLMNPWYDRAKELGRYFLSELVAQLFAAAAEEFAGLEAGAAPNVTQGLSVAVGEFSSHTPTPPPPAAPAPQECCPTFRSNACRPTIP
jgi:glutamate/tyrosine decarboxylase-like PLP-dependent enzyme